jgi:two-component system, sensor histidine kinase
MRALLVSGWQRWRNWVASHIDEDAQIYRQYQASAQSMWAGMAVGLGLAVFLWGKVAVSLIVGWLLVYVFLFVVRMVVRSQFMHLRPAGSALHAWAAVLVALVAASGFLWATTVPLFQAPSDPGTARLSLYVLGGSALAGLPMYAGFYPALLIYVSAMLLPAAVFFALPGSEGYFNSFLSVALWMIFLLQGRRQAGHLRQMIRMRQDKEQLSEQLLKENHAKEAALALAHEANATKTRLFSAISHDVRQPMSALALLADAAQRSEDPAQRDQLLAHMQRSVEVVNDLFSQVLELSQLDSGTVVLDMKPVAVDTLLLEIQQLFAAQIAHSGHSLTIETSPTFALADRACLQRIVLNLLGNALHHTPACALRLSSQKLGNQIVVTVSDEGPGIDQAKQAMIFEEFYKGGSVRHAQTDAGVKQSLNFGLGLAIARRLARAMGSDLSLVSKVGCGSAFSLTLSMAPTPAIEAAEVILQPASLLQGARIGIVDDDALSGQALVAWLQSCGAQPTWARNAQDTQVWLQQDAVVVDFQLREGLNGSELIDQLRKRWPGTGNTPIPALLISGVSPSAQWLEGVDFLPKPLTAIKLRAWLLHALTVIFKN